MVDRLRYWMSAQPEHVAYRFLVDGEDETLTLTYRQLDERVRACAAKLASLGLRGQRALLMYPSGLEFIVAFFGCLYAGVVPVPAFPPRRNRNKGRINAIADDAKPAIALTIRDVINRRDSLAADCESLMNQPWLATEEIPLELASDWVKPEITPDDLALMQYTSGSTGSPKGVVLTHANVLANCRYISTGFQITRECAGISWLPFYHDMGLIGGIVNPLYGGWAATLMSPVHFLAKPIRWLRALSKYRMTISGGPNFAYGLCCDKIQDRDCEGLDLSNWKLAFNGAEPIRAEVLQQFTAKFSKYGFREESHYPCYGMAETTLIITGGARNEKPIIRTFDADELTQHRVLEVDSGLESAKPLVGCGRAILDEEVIIVHPDSRRKLAEDKIGEIWVRSRSSGLGYWNKPEETAAIFQAELVDQPGIHYLRTGDLGFLHHGELFVAGRLKDMIIVRGVNRYPQDIEATVEQSSSRLRVGGAAAFALERWDRERLVIVAEVERGPGSVWSDVLRNICAEVTAEHDLPPDEVLLVRAGSVPKTSSGKVQRHACRQAYLDNKLLIVDRWSGETESATVLAEMNGRLAAGPANAELLEIVSQHVRSVAKERAKDLSSETNIVVDLGLDSLERLQIANSLEEYFGGRFPDDVLQEIETIGEVARAIEEYIGTERNGRLLPESDPLPRTRRITGEIPETSYKIEKMPEYIRFERLKSLMESSGVRNPFFSAHEGRIADTTVINGTELVSFSSYNYLGMSGDPDVTQMAIDAIHQFGTSASASRLVSGEKTIHKQLELELSDFLDVDDVITFAGGHATNESVIGHMVGPGDLIIHDALAHNSIIQGAELSGARRRPFDHNDWQALDQILTDIRRDYDRVMIAIEGLYSMDGDYPELDKFVEVKNRHKAWLFVDEAHSIGTMGRSGRGLAEVFNIPRRDVEMWMGTLSKSFGSAGGFIGGNRKMIEYLRYTTPGFVFAAGLPPGNVGAALGALRKIIKEPQRVETLRRNSELFLELARAAGLDTGLSVNSPIIPVITGNSLLALRLSEALFHAGINAQPILHPAVDEDKTRLRFFITCCHNEDQIRFAVDTISREWKKIAPRQAAVKSV